MTAPASDGLTLTARKWLPHLPSRRSPPAGEGPVGWGQPAGPAALGFIATIPGPVPSARRPSPRLSRWSLRALPAALRTRGRVCTACPRLVGHWWARVRLGRLIAPLLHRIAEPLPVPSWFPWSITAFPAGWTPGEAQGVHSILGDPASPPPHLHCLRLCWGSAAETAL